MGYSLWPPEGGSEHFQVEFWAEWREALAETAELVALNDAHFPDHCVPYWSGTVSNCTATSLTDADAEPDIWLIPGPCTGFKFFNLECPDSEHVPQYYDVVFSADPLDQRKYFRAQITGNDVDGNLSFSDITTHRDVYKQVSSFSELNGKRYWIMPRGGVSGVGVFWNDRWMTPPSGAQATGSATAVAAGEIIDDNSNFSTTNSGEVIFFVSGNLVRRSCSINAALKKIIFSGSDTPDGGTTYYIVPSGGVFFPRSASPPNRWYAGATESYVGLGPNMQTISVRHPAAAVEWSEGQSFCEDVSHPAKDAFNLKSEFDDQCSTADRFYAPDSWKAPLRPSQWWLEAVCGGFVEDKDYDDELGILPLQPALNFRLNNINSASSSATVSGGSVSFSVSIPSPYSSITLHYQLYDHRLRVVSSGTVSTSGTISFSDINSILEGRSLTLVTSRGWDRRLERTARYIYPRSWMTAPRNDEGEVISSPEDSEGGTGVWIDEEPDTHNCEYDDDGFPAFGLEAITNGQRFRYVANRWCDSIIAGGSYSNEPDDIDWIKWAEFQLPSDYEEYQQSKRGVVLEGSTSKEIKTSKTWWFGTLRTDSGLSTSATSTSLSDTSKSSSFFWDGATGRWLGFIIEIEIDGVWHKRPVTGFSGTTISWAEPLPAFTGTLAYRIPEPLYQRNRWKNRKLYVTHDGEEYGPFLITHSDNSSLFVDDLGFEPSAEDSWRVDEIEPGEVVLKTADGWERVSNSRTSKPDILTRYGRARKYDIPCLLVFEQLWKFRNSLTARRFDALVWHANEELNWWDYGTDLGFPAAYFREPSGAEWSYDEAWQANEDYANWVWYTFGAASGPSDNVSPRTWSNGYSGGIYEDTQGETMIESGNNYFAYPRATGLPTWRNSVATFYCMAGVAPATDDPNETTRAGPSGYKYDDNGTEFPFLRWSNLGAVGGTAETRNLGTRIGTPDIAQIPEFEQPEDALETPHGGYVSYNRWVGYMVLDECVVCSFKGSMQFLPPEEEE